MSRYEVRQRAVYDIYDTEIDEVITAVRDEGEAYEVAARLERRPVDSAPLAEAPTHDENVDAPFERREDDEPAHPDVGGSNIT